MTDDLSVEKIDKSNQRKTAIGWIKLACGITSVACFGYGIRAAYSQARPFKPNEISQRQVLSGLGFATRALTIATILACSGYALIVIAVSAALDVNTPAQFGKRMQQAFGSRFRIRGSETSQRFEDVFKDS